MSGGVSGSKDVMRDLLLRGEFSDMKIICQGITFKAHQAIVCTQSSYFRSAICGGFKETSAKVINLQEDEPETIERVLSFLYLGGYNEASYLEDKPSNTEPKEIHLLDSFGCLGSLIIAYLVRNGQVKRTKTIFLRYYMHKF
ncbi:BTB/POZ fold [Penicillium camemberti]|uniref:BTB/POZ fold n=1 Tax=Penicillium camemberti (strain FM 013) TaxID=1429867 RepID=A0A0G4PC74_PENC3|nr:BTB/POZ fold [Penicillium camemberti]